MLFINPHDVFLWSSRVEFCHSIQNFETFSKRCELAMNLTSSFSIWKIRSQRQKITSWITDFWRLLNFLLGCKNSSVNELIRCHWCIYKTNRRPWTSIHFMNILSKIHASTRKQFIKQKKRKTCITSFRSKWGYTMFHFYLTFKNKPEFSFGKDEYQDLNVWVLRSFLRR